jgi:thiosulfate dehydrogenase [quinone] large subunit
MKTLARTDTGIPVIEMMHEEPVRTRGLQRAVAALRIIVGWTFLWAFLDKALALGFTTGRAEDGTIDFFSNAGWFFGGSPTAGAVGFALKGPFADNIQSVTGYTMGPAGPQVAAWLDWVYMGSMLLIGLGLIFGVMTRLAAVGGIIWMAVFYLGTAIWPEHNPVVDDHVLTVAVLVALILANAGRYYGLGKVWQSFASFRDKRYLY